MKLGVEIIGLRDIKLDFGVIDPNDRINDLVGLDFLISLKKNDLLLPYVEIFGGTTL